MNIPPDIRIFFETDLERAKNEPKTFSNLSKPICNGVSPFIGKSGGRISRRKVFEAIEEDPLL